jgi:hypothetical protein
MAKGRTMAFKRVTMVVKRQEMTLETDNDSRDRQWQ